MQGTMDQAGYKINQATTKHAQTIGLIERSYQKLKKIPNLNVSVDQPQWDQDVNIAVMGHNTTYHTSLKCSPTEIFHGRTPHDALDLKFANLIRATSQPKDASKMLDEIKEEYRENVHNIVSAYHN